MIGRNLLQRLHLNSFTTRLVMTVILSVVLGLAGILWQTNRAIRTTVSEQIGITFAAQAESLGDLVGAFFLEKVSQIQAVALSDTIKESLAERNAEYSNDPAKIQAELEALDAHWLVADDDDPLIKAITTADETVNPVTFQLKDYVEAFPAHVEVFVTDRYGGLVAASNRTSDYYQADEAWWQAAWNEGEGAVFISEPIFDESAGVTAVQLAVPVRDEETESVIGIVRSTLIVDGLFDLVDSVQIGQTGHAVLFNREGEVLFDPRAGEAEAGSAGLAAETRLHFVRESAHYLIGNDEHQDLSIFGHGLIHVYESGENLPGQGHGLENQIVTAVANLGWAMVVRQEGNEAFVVIDQTTRNVSLTGLGVISLISLSLIVLSRSLTRPLLQLNQATWEIGTGRLDSTLPSSSLAEISQLSGSFDTMRQQLQASFAQLENQARRLALVTVISEQLSAVLKLEELLVQVVNQVKDSFDFYHTHIYLLDERQEYLVVAEGTGSAGAEMKAKGHRIALNAPASLVARAARSREVVNVTNVREAPDWLPNELLPNTYAEMAVPIILDSQVVGVLDVQADKIGGLNERDANLLLSLANHVAVAIRNARLFAEVETALADAHAAQARYLVQSWQKARMKGEVGQYYYTQPEAPPVSPATLAQAKQRAAEQHGPSLVIFDDNGAAAGAKPSPAIVAPVTLQNKNIGTIQVHPARRDQTWSEGDLALVSAVVDQLAQSAESLRLFEETRKRASREQLVGNINQKLRQAPDLESLMEMGISELSAILGVDRAFVRFGSAEQLIDQFALERNLNGKIAAELEDSIMNDNESGVGGIYAEGGDL